MQNLEDLETRIQTLETKTRTLPWTMVAVLVVVLGAAIIQYKVNMSLKSQIHDLQRIKSAEVSHAR